MVGIPRTGVALVSQLRDGTVDFFVVPFAKDESKKSSPRRFQFMRFETIRICGVEEFAIPMVTLTMVTSRLDQHGEEI